MTPVQKVIQILTGMVEKCKVKRYDEQVRVSSYEQSCDDTTDLKEVVIANVEEMIDMLKTDIQKVKTGVEETDPHFP